MRDTDRDTDIKVRTAKDRAYSSEAREALEASIVHWKENAQLKAVDVDFAKHLGSDNCPLCKLYYAETRAGFRCVGCPINSHTGQLMCATTPYIKCVRIVGYSAPIHLAKDLDLTPAKKRQLTIEWRAACMEEVDFLRSILALGTNSLDSNNLDSHSDSTKGGH